MIEVAGIVPQDPAITRAAQHAQHAESVLTQAEGIEARIEAQIAHRGGPSLVSAHLVLRLLRAREVVWLATEDTRRAHEHLATTLNQKGTA